MLKINNCIMNLNERISKIIDYSGFTSSEFADEIEVQSSSVSHITSGRNKPSLDFLIKVKERFPELHWDWLINGDGNMIIEKPLPDDELDSEPLPDLFTIVEDENFGRCTTLVESKMETTRDFPIPLKNEETKILSDSQPSENFSQKSDQNQIIPQFLQSDNNKKLKRIILFFDDGSFETYEQ